MDICRNLCAHSISQSLNYKLQLYR